MMMGRLPPNDFSEAVELLNFAFTSTLSREQLGKLITELQGTPELLRDSHFTPQALGQLIEMNSQVAIQALVELMQCFDAQITLSSGASYKTDEYVRADPSPYERDQTLWLFDFRFSCFDQCAIPY